MSDRHHHNHHNGHHNHHHHGHNDDHCGPIVPCFLEGAEIVTNHSEIPVESLRQGEMVLTRDSGFKPILWIGETVLRGAEADQHSPVSIPKDAFGPGLPHRELNISPNHKVLVLTDASVFGEREVLIEAKHLVGRYGIVQKPLEFVRYFHFMFDRHEVVASNGMWSESFQLTGADVLTDTAEELKSIFKDQFDGVEFIAARTVLKKHEAVLI